MAGRLAATVVLAAALAGSPASGLHGESCTAEGAVPAELIAAGTFVFSGALNKQDTTRHAMSLGPGPHALVLYSGFDTQMAVCKVGSGGSHACANGNPAPLPKLCAVPIPGNPGGGPAIEGPGDFVVLVRWDPAVPCGCPENHYVGILAGA